MSSYRSPHISPRNIVAPRAGRKPRVPFGLAIAEAPNTESTYLQGKNPKGRVPLLSGKAVEEAKKEKREQEERRLAEEQAKALTPGGMLSMGGEDGSRKDAPPQHVVPRHITDLNGLVEFQEETDKQLLEVDAKMYLMDHDPTFLPSYYTVPSTPPTAEEVETARKEKERAAKAKADVEAPPGELPYYYHTPRGAGLSSKRSPRKLPARPQLTLTSSLTAHDTQPPPKTTPRGTMVLKTSAHERDDLDYYAMHSSRRRKAEMREQHIAAVTSEAQNNEMKDASSPSAAAQPGQDDANTPTTAAAAAESTEALPWWKQQEYSSDLVAKCEALQETRARVLQALDDVLYQSYGHFMENPHAVFDFFVDPQTVSDCEGIDNVEEIMLRSKVIVKVESTLEAPTMAEQQQLNGSNAADMDDRHYGIEAKHSRMLQMVSNKVQASAGQYFDQVESDLREDAALEQQ